MPPVVTPGVGIFDSIPEELLIEISIYAISGDWPTSPLRLSRICRTWRRICFGIPQLWTKACLKLDWASTTTPQLHLLKDWFDRARDLPLRLHVSDPKGLIDQNYG